MVSRSLLQLPEKASDAPITLALAGEQLKIDRSAATDGEDDIVIISISVELKPEIRKWPMDRMRRPTEIESLLLIREGATTIVPITASNLQADLEIRGKVQLADDRTWTAPTLVGKRLFVRDRHKIMALDLE